MKIRWEESLVLFNLFNSQKYTYSDTNNGA